MDDPRLIDRIYRLVENEGNPGKGIPGLCDKCYTVFKPEPKKKCHTCICGARIPIATARWNYLIAGDSAYYGYLYGKAYEDQRREYGEIVERYFFAPPDSWLVSLVAVILINLGSDALYDMGKTGIKRVIEVLKSHEYRGHRKKQLASDERLIEEVITFVIKYYKKPGGISKGSFTARKTKTTRRRKRKDK